MKFHTNHFTIGHIIHSKIYYDVKNFFVNKKLKELEVTAKVIPEINRGVKL
jgi:hypothetical protein